jgi:SAM-dependent methyltransferase
MLGLKRQKPTSKALLDLKRQKPTSKALARAILEDARPYHPMNDTIEAGMKRPDAAFHARWQMLAAAISEYQPSNFCDLGCAEGFYVRRVAREHGIMSIGFDNSPTRLRWAMAQSELDDDWNAGFVRMDLSSESIATMPQFDAVACMSLLHHITHHAGIDEARAVLRGIAAKTRKFMAFDMGGPEETSNSWAGSLSMLAGDVDANIAALLRDSGFATVRILGHTQGYDSTAMRALFVALPAR